MNKAINSLEHLLLMVSNVEKASGFYGGAGMAGWLYGGEGAGEERLMQDEIAVFPEFMLQTLGISLNQ